MADGAAGEPEVEKVCVCWVCGEVRGRPNWWPNVLPGRCQGRGPARHWWVWAQVRDGWPDLRTATVLGCGLGQLREAVDRLTQPATRQDLSAARSRLREGSGKNMQILFTSDSSVGCELVTVTQHEFLCSDLIALIRDFLPDQALLTTRLVCARWAALDGQEWACLARCIQRYRKEMRPVVLREYSRVACHKLGGGLTVVGGAAIGVGTLLACLVLLRAGQVPALPIVGRVGTALALSVTGEGVNMIGVGTNLPQMPPRRTLLEEDAAAFLAAEQDFVRVSAEDCLAEGEEEGLELVLRPLLHAKYAPPDTAAALVAT